MASDTRIGIGPTLSLTDAAAPPSSTPPVSLPLRERERYQLLSEIARGGLGRVWRAHDKQLDRVVALKEVLPRDAASRARFVREALVTARLQHPGIVPVHEAGRWGSDEPFYVMKLVSGRTLAELIAERPTLAARLELLPSVIATADAIAYAHAQRVLHRDLKPANVIVGEFGETVVIDWGLARDLLADDADGDRDAPASADINVTVAGSVVGTPGYMSPEQANGEALDERADVYAIGALLYALLTGRPPHAGERAADVLRSVRDASPPPVSRLQPAVSPDLAAIVHKAMARDRAARYSTALELARDLKRFQAGQMVAAHVYSVGQRLERWIRRHRALAIALAAFVIVAAAGGALFVVRERGLRAVADRQNLALLEEQGRAALAAGRPLRGAPYLVAALQKDPDNVALRALATQAVRPLARLERQLAGGTQDVHALSFDAAGGRLLTSSSLDRIVKLWSVRDGRVLATTRRDSMVQNAAISPGGTYVAVGQIDGLHMFTADLAAPLWSVGRRTVGVWFTPDGTRLIAALWSGELQLRDVATGALLARNPHHRQWILRLAFAPDGRSFAVVSRIEEQLSLWDLERFEVRATVADFRGAPSGVAYSPDGRWLVTGDSVPSLQLRHAATGQRLYEVPLPRGAADPWVAFARDGRTVISTTRDGLVRTWHAASGALLDSFEAEPYGNLEASALVPDGSAIVTGAPGGTAHVWRLTAPGFRVLPYAPDERGVVHRARFSPDGARLYTVGARGVFEWDAATTLRRRSVPAPASAQDVAVSRDGARVAVIQALQDPKSAIWSVDTGTRIVELDGVDLHALAGSPDGATFATASEEGAVRLYDAGRAAPTVTFAPDDSTKTALAFSPDGHELAVGNRTGILYLVDPATATLRRSLAVHAGWIIGLAYDADGGRLVTSGIRDHAVKVWELRTSRLVREIAHDGNISGTDISPDGRWIATTADGAAWVWDVDSGSLLRRIDGASRGVTFARDGVHLVTTGENGFAVIWDLTLDPRSPEELAALVGARGPWRLVDGRLVVR